ncbi:MAG: TetR/AcrR family transcriptional regulator [Pseudomonadota bacterium]|nr:TetR/AcrR family transcriptional regulator [Pseudomonadota bacterium]
MRYKAGQKEETRRKMLEAAGRSFRRYGYSGIGVDGLAKAAGVTSGAFYSHFGSKDAAFDAALAAGLDEVIEAVPKFQSEHGADWVEAFAQYYLGKPHRSDLACGCAMATLTPEVIRSGPEVHAAFEKKMTLIADLVAHGLAGGSDEDRRARAWAMLGVLIGGLTVARAMKSGKAADEVAEAVQAAAIKAAGRTRSKGPDRP